MFRRTMFAAGLAFVVASPLAAPAAAQGELVVCCGVREDWCRPMMAAFERATGIRVSMTRRATGETLAQIRAERQNPRGAVWWGGTGDPHLQVCEGTGYEIGSMSIIEGARNMENARRFHDWALTAQAQSLAAEAKSYQLPSNREAPVPPEAPRFEDVKLSDYDFARFGSAAERTRILQRWDREVRSGQR